MDEIAISVDGLSKAFGSNEVLKNISLSVPTGSTLALLGRNGAGKTTTIRIMMGLISRDDGSVMLNGIDPAVDPATLRTRVGYLAEDQAMYPWMTPTELCRFLSPFYPSWDSQWASNFLDRFAIPRHTKIRRLSKGQTVKLGLAVALAHQPSIVILDDPSMGLDPIARKEFNRDLIEHLQSRGCTVLYSSHLLDEVEAVADSVAILDQGRILRSAETQDLKDEIKQIIVRRDDVRGAAPHGLLDVRRHDDRLVMVVDDARAYTEQLSRDCIEHQIIDLSLDEIFESLVIGRTTGWPNSNALESTLV